MWKVGGRGRVFDAPVFLCASRGVAKVSAPATHHAVCSRRYIAAGRIMGKNAHTRNCIRSPIPRWSDRDRGSCIKAGRALLFLRCPRG